VQCRAAGTGASTLALAGRMPEGPGTTQFAAGVMFRYIPAPMPIA